MFGTVIKAQEAQQGEVQGPSSQDVSLPESVIPTERLAELQDLDGYAILKSSFL